MSNINCEIVEETIVVECEKFITSIVNGVLYLYQLKDVNVTLPYHNELLIYDMTENKWKNTTRIDGGTF